MNIVTELKTISKEQAEEFIRNYKEGDPVPDEIAQYALDWGKKTAEGLEELAAEVKRAVNANRRPI